MDIQRFDPVHWPGVWSILEPVFREGTTYAVPRDMSEEAARDFWTGPGKQVWVAVDDGEVVGRLHEAFDHPQRGFVEALVMFKTLR